MVTIQITANEDGSRLDRLLRKKLPLKTLSDIYKMIRTGFVRVNSKRIKENHRLVLGDVLTIRINDAEISAGAKPEAGAQKTDLYTTDFYKRNLKIIYEDDAILACDKPPHLVVHPGTGHEGNATLIDLVKCYMEHKEQKDPDADPVLMHRLDRDTSGVILIAKNKGVVRKLHIMLRDHDMTKQYVAVCHGRPPKDHDIIVASLEKSVEENQGTKMSVGSEGVFAKTEYTVLSKGENVTKVKLDIFTGRTHQIRVHMSHIGCPLVGDVRYGDPDRDAALFGNHGGTRRLFLHAGLLSFSHPITGKKCTITVPEPVEFGKIIS